VVHAHDIIQRKLNGAVTLRSGSIHLREFTEIQPATKGIGAAAYQRPCTLLIGQGVDISAASPTIVVCKD
jgi:hypothetical protein